MVGRYPEDSNIIDFVQVKMLYMAEEYANAGNIAMAEAMWLAIDKYMSGSVDILFKNGVPYVYIDKNDAVTSDEKNKE